MMDIPFARGRHAAAGSASWARRRCSGSRCSARSSRALGGFPVARDGTDRKARARLDGDARRRASRARACSPRARASTGPKIAAAAAGRRVPRAASRACRSCRSASRAARRSSAAAARPIPRFDRVAIVVGEPIVPPPRTDGDRAARRGRRAHRASSHDALQQLFDEAMRTARSVAARLRSPSAASTVGRVEAAVVGERPPTRARAARVAAEHERGDGVERGDQLAQLARRREVLVLVGDVHRLDAVGRRELRDHRLDEILGRARAGGDADDRARRRARRGRARRGRRRAARSGSRRRRATFAERDRVRRVRAADHDDRVGAVAIAVQRGLAVGGREAEVVARRGPQLAGTASRVAVERCPSSRCSASVVWASSATCSGSATLGEHAGRGRPRARRGGSRRARRRACRRLRRGRRGRRRGS